MGKKRALPAPSKNSLQSYKNFLKTSEKLLKEKFLNIYTDYMTGMVFEEPEESGEPTDPPMAYIQDFIQEAGFRLGKDNRAMWPTEALKQYTPLQYEKKLESLQFGPAEMWDFGLFDKGFQSLLFRTFSERFIKGMPASVIPVSGFRKMPNNWSSNPMIVSAFLNKGFANLYEDYLSLYLQKAYSKDIFDYSKENIVHRFSHFIHVAIHDGRIVSKEAKTKEALEKEYEVDPDRLENDPNIGLDGLFSIGLACVKLWPDLITDEKFLHMLGVSYYMRYPTSDEGIYKELLETFPQLTQLWDSNKPEGQEPAKLESETTETATPVKEDVIEDHNESLDKAEIKDAEVEELEVAPKAPPVDLESLVTPELKLEAKSIDDRLSFGEKSVGYLGFIRNNYGNCLNFYPTAEVRKGAMIPIMDPKDQWPSFGAINLTRGSIRSNTGVKLVPNHFYFVQFDRADLEINVDTATGEARSDYRYKIRDFESLCHNKLISPMEDEGAYFIVYPTDDDVCLNETINVSFNQASDVVDETMKYTRARVVVAYDNKFFGPVRLTVLGSQLKVNLKDEYKDGVVPYFETDRLLHVKRNYYIAAYEEKLYSPRDILLTHNADVRQSVVDILSDHDLLERVLKQTKDLETEKASLINEWLEGLDGEDFLTTNPAINRYRQARIENHIARLRLETHNKEVCLSAINTLLSADRGHAKLEKLAKLLAKDEVTLNRFSSFKAIKDEEKALKAQVNDLSVEAKNLQKQIREHKSELLEGEEAKLKALQEEVQAEQDKLDGIASYKALLKARDKLGHQMADKEKALSDLDSKAQALEAEVSSLGDALVEAVKPAKMREIAFDPVLAHKFNEAASAWAQKETQDKTALMLNALESVPVSTLKGRALVDYLVKETAKHRAYDRNAILNLYICLAQSFITVLAGKPGSGKTSVCDIMAHVLGLNAVDNRMKTASGAFEGESLNRYLPVSVERGWTSKRDFLGYYNPLNQTFESQDPRRYTCFKILDKEAQTDREQLPFVMMLDEANLSQMEYYWADFMNICDQRTATSTISLGDGKQYRIPDTLRFMATINADQTTESLSPRLIDRSWVVTLPTPAFSSFDDFSPLALNENDPSVEIVSWQALQEALGRPQSMTGSAKATVQSVLEAFYAIFQSLGYSVSYRSRKAIAGYVSVAACWFEGSNETQKLMSAVDYAVAQKLLPCISLVGSHYEESLKALMQLCDKHGLKQSKEILTDILGRGERAMDMYTFF